MNGRTPILDHMAALADPIRVPDAAAARAARADRVGALRGAAAAAVHGQPPPEDAGRRRLGGRRGATARAASTAWRSTSLDPAARRLWPLIREQVASTNGAEQDERRLQSVLRRRRAEVARSSSPRPSGQWDRLREELFGDRFHLHALLALLDARWTVGDLGCGTGPGQRGAGAVRGARDRRRWLGRHAAGRAHAAAGARPTSTSAAATSRRCRSTTAQLDAAILSLVLHHVPEPGPRAGRGGARAEARRPRC